PREIRERAEARSPQPDYRFSSDGCSGGMSWIWRSTTGAPPPWEGCCVVHDFAYWQGGTRADRRAADRALRLCVQRKAGEYALVGFCLVWLLGWIMWLGVRLVGGPYLPLHFRWGYGGRWPRGYAALLACCVLAMAAPAAAFYRYDAPGHHERYSGRCFTVIDNRSHYRVRACAD